MALKKMTDIANNEVQVESAIKDAKGQVIHQTYAKASEVGTTTNSLTIQNDISTTQTFNGSAPVAVEKIYKSETAETAEMVSSTINPIIGIAGGNTTNRKILQDSTAGVGYRKSDHKFVGVRAEYADEADSLNSGVATSGQVLTADGQGGASWQTPSSGGGGDTLFETTYAQLVSLVNNSGLQAGAWYRITDYVTKINGVYDISLIVGSPAYIPYATSAEHPFDLLVLAISENELNENALACLHDGDTYFANNNLGAWEVKYTIENDPTKYSWADSTSGKGVIYWLKDEFGNEAWYDFKNVQYVQYALKSELIGDQEELVDTSLAYDPNDQPNRYGSMAKINDALQNYMQTGVYTSPYSRDYDFYVGANILGVIQFSEVSAQFLSAFNAGLYYTFDYNGTDYSLNGAYCFENVIEHTADALTTLLGGNVIPNGLPLNVFMNNDSDEPRSCFGNKIGANCFINVFGSNTVLTKMRGNDNFNTFGNACNYNTFGNYCNSNIFGNYCNSNIFGNACDSNIFGNYCYYNTFGNNCYSNTFGNDYDSNTFGNACYYNTFGNNCHSNTFGNDYDSNTFGNACNYNTFGNYCDYNTFGNNCYSNTLNSRVGGITLVGSGYDPLQYVTIHSGVNSRTITVARGLTYPTDIYADGVIAENGIVPPLTTAPTAANPYGLRIVVLSAEPATRYSGYIYIILGA